MEDGPLPLTGGKGLRVINPNQGRYAKLVTDERQLLYEVFPVL